MLGLERMRNPPGIVGGTGGSGTSAVAGLLRSAGMYVGANLNGSLDAVEFGDFSDRWINEFSQADGVWDPRRARGPSELEATMVRDLEVILERHLRRVDDTAAWGWKEPRSAYLLPFWTRHLPGLRYLHVVRDGRDMALSGNQNQLRKHGVVLGQTDGRLPPPVQSLRLWSWLNVRVARFGALVLGERYLRIRFEDLCHDPVGTGGRILSFFGLSGSAANLTAHIEPPRSLGRWRGCAPDLLAELDRVGGAALAELGYEPTSMQARHG